MISRPTHLTCTEDDLNRLLAFRWEQSLKVNMDTPKLLMSLNILERMGLGNQMLMVRLSLPLRLSHSPTRSSFHSSPTQNLLEACSSISVKRKGLNMASMHGIGKNLVGGRHGRTSKRHPCQLSRKPTSCVMSTPLTSSKLSKVWSPRLPSSPLVRYPCKLAN